MENKEYVLWFEVNWKINTKLTAIWGFLQNHYQSGKQFWTWQKCVLLKRHSISSKVHLSSSEIFHHLWICGKLSQADRFALSTCNWEKEKPLLSEFERKNHGRKNVSKILLKKSARKFLLFVVEVWFGSWPEGSIKGCKWQCHAIIWSKKSSNYHPLPNSWDRPQNQMFRCFVATEIV